jgi:hypothetical protein
MAENPQARYNERMKEEAVSPVTHATLDGRGDDLTRHAAYGLAAEVRAVESGHNARVLPDGSLLVRSDTLPGSHRVWVRGVRDGTVLLGCTCRSGTHRASLPVPCKHAALAGRRLERESLARWHDGTWQLPERAQVRGLRLQLARSVGHRPGSRSGAGGELRHAAAAA